MNYTRAMPDVARAGSAQPTVPCHFGTKGALWKSAAAAHPEVVLAAGLHDSLDEESS